MDRSILAAWQWWGCVTKIPQRTTYCKSRLFSCQIYYCHAVNGLPKRLGVQAQQKYLQLNFISILDILYGWGSVVWQRHGFFHARGKDSAEQLGEGELHLKISSLVVEMLCIFRPKSSKNLYSIFSVAYLQGIQYSFVPCYVDNAIHLPFSFYKSFCIHKQYVR